MKISKLSTISLATSLAGSVSGAAIIGWGPDGTSKAEITTKTSSSAVPSDVPNPKDCNPLKEQERIDCLNYNYEHGFYNGPGYEDCTHSKAACYEGTYHVCVHGAWLDLGCPAGTYCFAHFDQYNHVVDANCDYPLTTTTTSTTSSASSSATSKSTSTSTTSKSTSTSTTSSTSSSSTSKTSSSTTSKSTATSTTSKSTSTSTTSKSTSTSTTSKSTSASTTSKSTSTSTTSSTSSSATSKTSSSTTSKSTSSTTAPTPTNPVELKNVFNEVSFIQPKSNDKPGPFEHYHIKLTWTLDKKIHSLVKMNYFYLEIDNVFMPAAELHALMLSESHQVVGICKSHSGSKGRVGQKSIIKCELQTAVSRYKYLKGWLSMPVIFDGGIPGTTLDPTKPKWKVGDNKVVFNGGELNGTVRFPAMDHTQPRAISFNDDDQFVYVYFVSEDTPCPRVGNFDGWFNDVALSVFSNGEAEYVDSVQMAMVKELSVGWPSGGIEEIKINKVTQTKGKVRFDVGKYYTQGKRLAFYGRFKRTPDAFQNFNLMITYNCAGYDARRHYYKDIHLHRPAYSFYEAIESAFND